MLNNIVELNDIETQNNLVFQNNMDLLNLIKKSDDKKFAEMIEHHKYNNFIYFLYKIILVQIHYTPNTKKILICLPLWLNVNHIEKLKSLLDIDIEIKLFDRRKDGSYSAEILWNNVESIKNRIHDRLLNLIDN